MNPLPDEIQTFLKDNPGLIAVESDHRNPGPSWDIQCTNCKTDLWVSSVVHEAGEFRFWRTFSNGKTEIVESDIILKCDCENPTDPGDLKTYEPPESFEMNW